MVGLRHDLVEKRRKEMKQAEFSRSMYPRNGIEGTHSELVRGHGLRQTKYRGIEPSQPVALLHGCCLQRETLFKTAFYSNGTAEGLRQSKLFRVRIFQQFQYKLNDTIDRLGSFIARETTVSYSKDYQ